MLALAAPALGMRLGESGADSLPRSIPVMRTYDAMTAAFPQTGFAHTVVVWSDDGRLDRAAVRSRRRELVVRRRGAPGGSPTCPTPRSDFAPDGRTAQPSTSR